MTESLHHHPLSRGAQNTHNKSLAKNRFQFNSLNLLCYYLFCNAVKAKNHHPLNPTKSLILATGTHEK